jgi:hypothetical protein
MVGTEELLDRRTAEIPRAPRRERLSGHLVTLSHWKKWSRDAVLFGTRRANTEETMRKSTLVAIVVLIGALGLGGTAIAAVHAAKPSLAGTWSGSYSGAYTGTFTIHWRQSGPTLRGSITLSKPSGTFSITGSVRGGASKFGAVGAGATYSGSVSGKSMSGSYKTAQGGGKWSAHKS